MIILKIKTDFNNVSGEIFDQETDIKMGDIVNNEISIKEIKNLSDYFQKENIKSGIPITEKQFFDLIKYCKKENILIFKDLNGNYQENFNTDPEVHI